MPKDRADPADPAGYRAAMRRLASGVWIVTSGDEAGARLGLTVTAVTSVSAAPPTVLVCVNRSAEAHGLIVEAGHFGLSLLGEAESELAQLFSGQAGIKGAARFQTAIWESGPLSSPLLASALVALDCAVLDEIPGGDSHSIFLGRVQHARHQPAPRPMVYLDGGFGRVEAPSPPE